MTTRMTEKGKRMGMTRVEHVTTLLGIQHTKADSNKGMEESYSFLPRLLLHSYQMIDMATNSTQTPPAHHV